MSKFTGFIQDATDVLNKMCESSDLIKCIANNSKNYLDGEIPDINSLKYTQIIPFRITADIVEQNKTYISFIFNEVERSSNSSIKNAILEFHIYTHKDNLITDYGLRHYMLAHYIDDIFNAAKLSGIGKIEFESYKDLPSPIGNTYVYQNLKYKTSYF